MLIKIVSKEYKEILFFEAVYCKYKEQEDCIYVGKHIEDTLYEKYDVKGKKVYINSFELK